jgi:hypothetical protein
MAEMKDRFQIKVFILYLLKNIREPLEYKIINDMVMQDGFVSSRDFPICFCELLDLGQIVEERIDGRMYYRISELGAQSVSSVEFNLYDSVKEKALRSAHRLLAFYKTGNMINAEITPEGEGYMVKCSITDKDKTLLDLNVYLTDDSYAEVMKENFTERAEVIYKGVLALLSGDVNYIFDE